MPTILHINVVANQGSTGKIAEQIGGLVKQKGWRSIIAYGRWQNESESDLIRIGSDWGVRLHALKSRFFDNSGLCSNSATRHFIEQIKILSPDIIHLSNIHGYYINYKILFDFLKAYGKPVVWTLHDCWPITGHCAYFDYPKCHKWKIGCGGCPCLDKYPKSLGFDRSDKNYLDKKKSFLGVGNLTLIPVSNWLEGLLKESFLKEYPMRMIHNGIDLSNFKPAARPNDGKFRIIGVSNIWEPRKGLPDVLKLREMLSPDYEITIVGLSKKQISQLPIGINGISRTGSQLELSRLYAESDVLINPTYEDNYPTVNLEALACGTPVITYRTGGSPESLTSESGVVVNQGDVKAMADAIMQMKKRPMSSDACRMHALECFDKDKCFERYVELYEELLRN
ncbi:MAG: glycosyltransferase [Bacteroidaceae bacterium]|nr:glycosyltransferase [Bacteroidaceae bacterium]